MSTEMRDGFPWLSETVLMLPVMRTDVTASRADSEPRYARAFPMIAGSSARKSGQRKTAVKRQVVSVFMGGKGCEAGSKCRGGESIPLPHRFQQETYSHSIVAGGLELTSRTTRETPRTSLVIRLEIRCTSKWGSRVQSAVMASMLSTIRSDMTYA